MASRSRTSFWRLAALIWGLALFGWAGPLGAQPGVGPDESPTLSELLAGILYYTRWPQPVERPRLCLGQGAPESAMLVRELEIRESPPALQTALRSLRLDAAERLLDCQAIYFGALPPRELQPLLLRLNRHPILTIGQGDEFCSFGGKFCLVPVGRGLQIKANLDAISYSGLRVNARLLQLTVRPAGGRP